MRRKERVSVPLDSLVWEFAFDPTSVRQEFVGELNIFLREMNAQGKRDWLSVIQQAKRILIIGPSETAAELDWFIEPKSGKKNGSIRLKPQVSQLTMIDRDKSALDDSPWSLFAALRQFPQIATHPLSLERYVEQHVKQGLLGFDLITFLRADLLSAGELNAGLDRLSLTECFRSLLLPGGYALISSGQNRISQLEKEAVVGEMVVEQATTPLSAPGYHFAHGHAGLVLRQPLPTSR